jgi:hypothetical protein
MRFFYSNLKMILSSNSFAKNIMYQLLNVPEKNREHIQLIPVVLFCNTRVEFTDPSIYTAHINKK